jgi:hypothetical protein
MGSDICSLIHCSYVVLFKALKLLSLGPKVAWMRKRASCADERSHCSGSGGKVVVGKVVVMVTVLVVSLLLSPLPPPLLLLTSLTSCVVVVVVIVVLPTLMMLSVTWGVDRLITDMLPDVTSLIPVMVLRAVTRFVARSWLMLLAKAVLAAAGELAGTVMV